MTHHPPCIHPSCPASPAPGRCLCDSHGGRLALPAARWPQAPGHAPTLNDEIARLTAQRDLVERSLRHMLAGGTAGPVELRRTLAALSQTGRSLVILLDKHGAGEANDLQKMLADAARLVRERAAQKVAQEKGTVHRGDAENAKGEQQGGPTLVTRATPRCRAAPADAPPSGAA